MKLRNKKTGEIGWLYCDHISIPKKMTVFAEDKDLSANHWDYASLAELNEEWEDYEEPEEYWCITGRGNLHYLQDMTDENDKDHREIGNYFETKEEAEKAVEKLKAWKRLKDKGLEFDGWILPDRRIGISLPASFFPCKGRIDKETEKDLDLLFGGEK